jgi:hypothetical protein
MESTLCVKQAQDDAVVSLDGAAAVDFFPFAALPPPLALQIFEALPADTRLRCVEVCTDWRDKLAERSLWTRLDLSDTSGVAHAVTPALLRAAAAKARGALTALDVSGAHRLSRDAGLTSLRSVLAANAGTLRELRCWHTPISVKLLETLLRAAPRLRVCEADVDIDAATADRAGCALRNEGARSRRCGCARRKCRHTASARPRSRAGCLMTWLMTWPLTELAVVLLHGRPARATRVWRVRGRGAVAPAAAHYPSTSHEHRCPHT